jgi:hypothetical protein
MTSRLWTLPCQREVQGRLSGRLFPVLLLHIELSPGRRAAPSEPVPITHCCLLPWRVSATQMR